jgi:hypothetical protein
MASGFLILSDGRCFSVRWSAHDVVLRAIAEQCDTTPTACALREWLLSLLPGPNDEEHVGYGPWYRVADQQLVPRFLDLRELTVANQRLFHQAARRAAVHVQSPGSPLCADWLRECLAELADMVERADQGEPPLSRSHWTAVRPSEGRQLGPGWSEP